MTLTHAPASGANITLTLHIRVGRFAAQSFTRAVTCALIMALHAKSMGKSESASLESVCSKGKRVTGAFEVQP